MNEKEQNIRMRKWFKSRTNLDSDYLFDHMNKIDELLATNDRTAIELLKKMFDLYEKGENCYDGWPEDGVYIGNAVRLDDELHDQIVDMLSRSDL